MSDFKKKFYLIEDFIDFVKEKKDRAARYDPSYSYDVYCENSESSKNIYPKMKIFIGDTVQSDDDGNEIYPEYVKQKNLAFLYSCDNFQDVVDLAFKQKKTATTLEVIECLNYFDKHDDFLDLDQ